MNRLKAYGEAEEAARSSHLSRDKEKEKIF